MKQCWAYYQVYSHSVLQTIQRELRPMLPPKYEQIQPDEYHLTVYPQYQFKVADAEKYENMVRSKFPSSITITSDSFHFYPSESEPRVICVNVDTNIPLVSRQQELITDLRNSEGESMMEPTTPHITLFRVDDPHDASFTLPKNIDEIRSTCTRLESEQLPVTFTSNDTEFKIERVQ